MYYVDQFTDSLIEAFPGKHVELRAAPKTQSAFISMCISEMSHARYTQNAFLSYQTALEDQKALSEEFRISERASTWTAVNQLQDVREELADLIDQATALTKRDSEVTEDMQVDLDYARSIASHHRATIHDNHIFYKVNWSLAINKTGLIALKRLLIPGVNYYLKNKWGAQYWENPVTRRSPRFMETDGFLQFLSNKMNM